MKLSFFMLMGVFCLVNKVYANDPTHLNVTPFNCNPPDQAGHPYDPKCYFSNYYTQMVYPSLPSVDQQIDRTVAQKSSTSGNWKPFRNIEDRRVNNYVAAESATRCFTQLADVPKVGQTSCSDAKAIQLAVNTPEIKKEVIGLAEPLPRKLQEGDVCASSQLPGSGKLDRNFLQAVTADPADPLTLYGMSTQYDGGNGQARYVSVSKDGGRTWIPIRKIPTPPGNGIFEANDLNTASLSVTGGGKNISFTTRNGVFQMAAPFTEIKKLKLPDGVPAMEGGSIKISPDQGTMVVSYGHLYNTESRVVLYEKDASGQWTPKTDHAALPPFDDKNAIPPPKAKDVFSVQMCTNSESSISVGLGRYQYRYDADQKKWLGTTGMESSDRSVYGSVCHPDGSMTVATCGGIYETAKDKVTRKVNVSVGTFRTDDHREIKGYTFLRALSIDQNPQGQMVVGSGTGVYFSPDGGKTWKSANDAISPVLSDPKNGDMQRSIFTTHVNPDGSMLVSGSRGTYVLDKDGSCAK